MKKNKLYTVNRWNRPAFMPEPNIFAGGGWSNLAQADKAVNPWNYADDVDTTQQYMQSKNAFGISKADNPFSKGNLQGGLKSMVSTPIGGALVGAGAGLVGGLANKAISGGLSSGAGSAISDLGSTVGSAVGSVNPILGAGISIGSQVLGGVTNALFGESVDEEALKEANEGTAALTSFKSNAGSFDEIKGPEAVANVNDVYKGGLFNDVSGKNEELKRQRREAQMFADRSVTNNVNSLVADQNSNLLANFSAFGGPIDTTDMGAIDYGFMSDWLTLKEHQNKDKKNTFRGGGKKKTYADSHISDGAVTTNVEDRDRNYWSEIINHGDTLYAFSPANRPIFIPSDKAERRIGEPATEEYLRLQQMYRNAREGAQEGNIGWNQMKDDAQDFYDWLVASPIGKGARVVGREAKKYWPFAFGGDLQVHGADFPTRLTHINAGGSHEANPNDGVQLGVDSEGTPNLVEEGETVFDDYVYSNRILADAQTKEKFGLPRKKDITFADISKKLEKESSERPNDPISISGLKAQMHQLADEQERQKQEMDAQRAKAAFEALSPEEQVAVMENAAQQEVMTQQAAMQQPSPEEIAMAQQQQAMADGSEAMIGQEPQMMAAEGGKLFAPGGYLWDKFWSPVNEYSKKKGNTKGKYQIDKTYKDNIKALEESEAYKAFTNYILNNASDEERLKYFRWIDDNTGRDRVYTNEKGELLDGWQDKYKAARYDGLYGIQHYTPEFDPILGAPAPEVKPEVATAPEGRVFHAMDGDDYDGYIEGELDPNVVGAETRRETLPNGDIVIYHGRAKAPVEEKAEESAKNLAPKRSWEGLRYAGLFGPAVGLGMMAAGIGRPGTAQLDAAVAGAGDVNTADWKPLGNYLTYRPLDIWFEQNRLNANARATDRAILNSGVNQGSKMIGLLAAGYNDQIASGNLFRQAQEYNDNLRKQVAEFNRGTDQWNSGQYGETSRFNASARNQARQHNAQLRLQAAREKADMDAGWYNSLYGNVAGLFKGISDIGVENKRDNMINWMISKGIFGAVDPNDLEMKKRVKVVSAEGGKLKKNKRRGLTF